MRNQNVLVIPHDLQRYDTLGDWYVDPFGVLQIHVSRLSDWRSQFAIAVHEMVEAELCERAGITAEEVDNFDMTFIGEGEPGDDRDCPYLAQHQIAEQVERAILAALGLSWEQHCKVCEEPISLGVEDYSA